MEVLWNTPVLFHYGVALNRNMEKEVTASRFKAFFSFLFSFYFLLFYFSLTRLEFNKQKWNTIYCSLNYRNKVQKGWLVFLLGYVFNATSEHKPNTPSQSLLTPLPPPPLPHPKNKTGYDRVLELSNGILF